MMVPLDLRETIGGRWRRGGRLWRSLPSCGSVSDDMAEEDVEEVEVEEMWEEAGGVMGAKAGIEVG